MRGATLTVLAVAGIMMLAASGPRGSAEGLAAVENAPGSVAPITVLTAADEGGQQLILIDPRVQVMGVYHIERSTGAVQLKSVRNFSWDLQLTEFNGTDPRPQEIRGMVGRK